ncbi:MAG: HEPN domain-containing protein [Pirellulaceae bacterium]
MQETSATGEWTVHLLRRRWKPHKERLLAKGGEQTTCIRFHRACSWLARTEDGAGAEDHDLDLDLISLWIAFNSLYGQWDEQRQEPKPDRETWRAFVDAILRLDRSEYVSGALTDHKRLVMTLLEDKHLSKFFWQEPSAEWAGQSRRSKYKAGNWYTEHRWTMILDHVLDRIYLMRCQLVHGAATYGGKLNRTSLRRCVTMMQRLLPAFLLVWIDHGSDEDWGPICYPPPPAKAGSPETGGLRSKKPR